MHSAPGSSPHADGSTGNRRINGAACLQVMPVVAECPSLKYIVQFEDINPDDSATSDIISKLSGLGIELLAYNSLLKVVLLLFSPHAQRRLPCNCWFAGEDSWRFI